MRGQSFDLPSSPRGYWGRMMSVRCHTAMNCPNNSKSASEEQSEVTIRNPNHNRQHHSRHKQSK